MKQVTELPMQYYSVIASKVDRPGDSPLIYKAYFLRQGTQTDTKHTDASLSAPLQLQWLKFQEKSRGISNAIHGKTLDAPIGN